MARTRKGQAINGQAKHSDREDLIMAIPSQIDPSPFFEVLPPELRLMIYEEIFEGSQACYKQEYTVGSHTQHHVLLPTYHYKFLLTCRQAYNEALKTYWSKTILYGDYADRDLVFFLRSVVPDFAKLHVRHIRGLNDYDVRRSSIRGCLEDFKKLQTIAFKSRWFFNMNPYIRNDEMPPEMEEQVEEHLKRHDPGPGEFSQLIYDGGPAVLGRVLFCRGEIDGPYLTEGRYAEDRKVINLTRVPCTKYFILIDVQKLLTFCSTGLLHQLQHRQDV